MPGLECVIVDVIDGVIAVRILQRCHLHLGSVVTFSKKFHVYVPVGLVIAFILGGEQQVPKRQIVVIPIAIYHLCIEAGQRADEIRDGAIISRWDNEASGEGRGKMVVQVGGYHATAVSLCVIQQGGFGLIVGCFQVRVFAVKRCTEVVVFAVEAQEAVFCIAINAIKQIGVIYADLWRIMIREFLRKRAAMVIGNIWRGRDGKPWREAIGDLQRKQVPYLIDLIICFAEKSDAKRALGRGVAGRLRHGKQFLARSPACDQEKYNKVASIYAQHPRYYSVNLPKVFSPFKGQVLLLTWYR